jgi:uncharacterized paraquat-inducible protein A
MNINEARCLECGHRLRLGAHPHKGQRLICPLCETSLTITSLNPVELDLTMSVNRAVSTKKRPHSVDLPCPECEEFLRIIPHTYQGYQVRCSSCDTILEVVSTNPLELDVASTVRLKYSHRDTLDERRSRSSRKAGRARR